MGSPRPQIKFVGECLAAAGRTLTFEAAPEDVKYFVVGEKYVIDGTPVGATSGGPVGGPQSGEKQDT